jgi:hypothetical protein
MTRKGLVAELNQFAAVMNDLAPSSRMDRLHDLITQTKRDMEAVRDAVQRIAGEWPADLVEDTVGALRAMLGDDKPELTPDDGYARGMAMLRDVLSATENGTWSSTTVMTLKVAIAYLEAVRPPK